MHQILYIFLLLTTLTPSWALGKPVFKIAGVDSIYGIDDREFVTKYSRKKIRDLSRSVALIVNSDIVEIGLFQSKIKGTSLAQLADMCLGEKFSDDMSLAGCSGFLVGQDILVCAGHCFETVDDCKNKKTVFDVSENKQTDEGYKVSSSNVFGCTEILFQKHEDELDYAIIKLDRIPRGRALLKVNTSKKIEKGSSVFMIGHQMGLPLILSKSAIVTNVTHELIFGAELDSFTGNSGSPVFNSITFEVEGILINGQMDLVKDPSSQCYRNAIYNDYGAEGIFRSTELPVFLK